MLEMSVSSANTSMYTLCHVVDCTFNEQRDSDCSLVSDALSQFVEFEILLRAGGGHFDHYSVLTI